MILFYSNKSEILNFTGNCVFPNKDIADFGKLLRNQFLLSELGRKKKKILNICLIRSEYYEIWTGAVYLLASPKAFTEMLRGK